MAVHTITNLAEFTAALSKSRVAVMDFYSTQCPPCKVVAPLYQALSEKFSDAEFYQINGLSGSGLEVQKSIDVVWWPTFVLYVDGVEKWRAKIPNPPQRYPTNELESQLAKYY